MQTTATFQELTHRGEHARMPFQVDDDLLTLKNLQGEAIAAGLKNGDRLLEMRGEPVSQPSADGRPQRRRQETSCTPATPCRSSFAAPTAPPSRPSTPSPAALRPRLQSGVDPPSSAASAAAHLPAYRLLGGRGTHPRSQCMAAALPLCLAHRSLRLARTGGQTPGQSG